MARAAAFGLKAGSRLEPGCGPPTPTPTSPEPYDMSRVLTESAIARAHRKDLDTAFRAFQRVLSCIDVLGKKLTEKLGSSDGQARRALLARLDKLRREARAAKAESVRRLQAGEKARTESVLACAARVARALRPGETSPTRDRTDALLAQMDIDGCVPEQRALEPIELPRGTLPSECEATLAP